MADNEGRSPDLYSVFKTKFNLLSFFFCLSLDAGKPPHLDTFNLFKLVICLIEKVPDLRYPFVCYTLKLKTDIG